MQSGRRGNNSNHRASIIGIGHQMTCDRSQITTTRGYVHLPYAITHHPYLDYLVHLGTRLGRRLPEGSANITTLPHHLTPTTLLRGPYRTNRSDLPSARYPVMSIVVREGWSRVQEPIIPCRIAFVQVRALLYSRTGSATPRASRARIAQ